MQAKWLEKLWEEIHEEVGGEGGRLEKGDRSHCLSSRRSSGHTPHPLHGLDGTPLILARHASDLCEGSTQIPLLKSLVDDRTHSANGNASSAPPGIGM